MQKYDWFALIIIIYNDDYSNSNDFQKNLAA